MIAVVGVVVAGATGAFFSDTETSTGNTFTAGAIDLQIDNESYVTNNEGELVSNEDTSWALDDLTNQLFFDFEDLKPGDVGEDTISIHVTNNDAWACMAVDITATPENTLLEPEVDDNDVGPAQEDNGELQNYLEFAFWHDDGDNVYEDGEEIFWEGEAGEMFNGDWQTIADSNGDDPLPGGETVYVAKAWCFGTLTPDAEPQEEDLSPLDGTGFTCDGTGDGDQNDAQTDGVVMDVSFYAVQERNNPEFSCSSLDPLND